MFGLFSRAVAPSISSSVVSGSQKSGMPHPASFAPKNPGAATPITVNECPLIW